ncbi:enoyl-CoA hydratase/isomerase family protein [Rhodoferax sp. AJA081-3]|uniref:enoyl-CoA hydratase/isomerase family protein n=1 Tax=Rhodoferax sp. AJA081-3 TaxID=2752316 RepID=UPI001ADECBF7|nr:enoyl-CoA hydratase/isomerase family protein [Rhodoferax sp. AJA081-3]QTN28721.1 enoyl-CoA hydratase/isomerase family protein [Rhodoferax sp. AJA081-3]
MNENNTSNITEVHTTVAGGMGLITLNRPKALNALSLPMVQALLTTLQAWRDDPAVFAVAIRGSNKTGQPGSPEALFGGFCAGGDIRFFHQAALSGDAALDTFFTDEYTLNHLIHNYPKPYVAFMDGIVMGGGMGISQGASLRIVTETTKMAMPETGIGLFPDVGGGYFLSRCPGHVGEYLALTGDVISGAQAVAWGLADVCVPSARLPELWAAMQTQGSLDALQQWIASNVIADSIDSTGATATFDINDYAAFGLGSIPAIVAALEASGTKPARAMAATLRHRSPLMLHVVLEQIRRARDMGLADDLRMERDLVQHCFYTAHLDRSGVSSETVEGIRALAIDKDHKPVWNPARIADVTPDMVAPFFVSPWPAGTHPLKDLA